MIQLFETRKSDIRAVLERDPAARSKWEVIFLYSGYKAVRSHRRAHWFLEHGHPFIARWISQRCRHKTGIEIHPGAQIGKGLFIDHGMGVVIGETTIIGDNCTIYQNVTLGGTGKDTGKRHPTLGDNVLVGSGAKVVNGIRSDMLDQIHISDPVAQALCKLEYRINELQDEIKELKNKE